MSTGRHDPDEPTLAETLHDFGTPEDADLTADVDGTGPQGGAGGSA